MNHVRGRDRRQARSLGRGARTLIGIALTLLLLAMQAQFVAGAKSPGKDKKGGPAAESTEVPGTEAPAEEPPPAPEPSEDPPADDGGDASGGGESDDGETGTEPGGSTDPEDPATDSGGATSDDDGEGRLRRLNGFRAERALAQPPDPKNPDCGDFGLLQLTRFDPVPSSGSATQDGVTITITDSEDNEATEFSWTSVTPIDLVIVKAGPGATLYSYDEATSDRGLTGPERKGISHISFCYDVEEDEPDVTVSKSADFEGDELLPGDSVTYTITVTNDGTGTAEEVTLSDDLDDALEDVTAEASQGTCSVGTGNTLSCDLGDIDEGDSVTVTITATVPDDFCGELTNQATVDAENDTNSENNESETVKVTVECQPDVGVEKSAVIEGNPLPGEEFDFVITVTNVGTGTAEDVVLTDVIQQGLVIVNVPDNCTIEPGEDGETVTCDLGDIEEGDFVTVKIRVSVADDYCGPLENTAEVTSPSDSNSENDSDTITFEAVCQPDVSVEKSSSVPEIGSGGNFGYTITVTNEGTGTVEGVILSDNLDDNLLNVTATPSQGSCVVGSLNTLTCNLGDIAQGGSVTITIEVDVPAEFCGFLENHASVAAENDSNPQNNESEPVIVEVPCGPDIDVRKTNDADADGSFHDEEEALHEGDAVTFKVVITNTGNVAIELTDLTDEYPLGVGVPFDQECLTAEGDNVVGMILEPGASLTCFFTIEGYAPEPNGAIVDRVTVTGIDEDEDTVSDFDDSTVTTPEVLPEPPIRPEPPAPPAPPILPVTGAELALMGLVALGLVLAGIVLSYLGRKEDEPGM